MVYQLPLEEQEELIDHFTDHIFQCAEKVPYDCLDLTLQLSQFDCAIYASDIVQKLMERSKEATDFENLPHVKHFQKNSDLLQQCLCQWTSYEAPQSQPAKDTTARSSGPAPLPATSPFGQVSGMPSSGFSFGSPIQSMANPFVSKMEVDGEPSTAKADNVSAHTITTANGGPAEPVFAEPNVNVSQPAIAFKLPPKPVVSNAAKPSSSSFLETVLDGTGNQATTAAATAVGSEHTPFTFESFGSQEKKAPSSNDAPKPTTSVSGAQTPTTAGMTKQKELPLFNNIMGVSPTAIPGLSPLNFASSPSKESVTGTASGPTALPSKPVTAIPPPAATTSSTSSKRATEGTTGSASTSSSESSGSTTTSATMPARKIAPLRKSALSSVAKSEKVTTVASETTMEKSSEHNSASGAKDTPDRLPASKSTMQDTARVEATVASTATDSKLELILALLQSEQAARTNAETKQQKSNEDMLQRLARIEADLAQQKQALEAKDKELADQETAVAKREAELKAELAQQKQSDEAKEKALREREAAVSARENVVRANEKLIHDKVEQFKQTQQDAHKKLELVAKNLKDAQRKKTTAAPTSKDTTVAKTKNKVSSNAASKLNQLFASKQPHFDITSLLNGSLLLVRDEDTVREDVITQLESILQIFKMSSSTRHSHATKLMELLYFKENINDPDDWQLKLLHQAVKPAALLFANHCIGVNLLLKRSAWCDGAAVTTHHDVMSSVMAIVRYQKLPEDMQKVSRKVKFGDEKYEEQRQLYNKYGEALAMLRQALPLDAPEYEVLVAHEKAEGRRLVAWFEEVARRDAEGDEVDEDEGDDDYDDEDEDEYEEDDDDNDDANTNNGWDDNL